jgi:arylsulfatase A-like enzyme
MRVLLIAPRGLNLSHLGCYGNRWIDTSNLDRLAAEGVVFDHHYADRPDAAGARKAWRTGRHSYPHPTPAACSEPTPDVLVLLRSVGVRTLLILDESRPAPEEFAAGWDEVIRVPAEAEEGTALERSLEATVEAVGRLDPSGRWLVWLDLATALPPWDVPPEFVARYFDKPPAEDEEEEEEQPGLDEDFTLAPLPNPESGALDPDDDATIMRAQRSLAAAVTYLDSGLGLLREHIKFDELHLIVTSDRGQPLGEHGLIGDVGAWPHEERVHVPLIVRTPETSRAGNRVAALTQPADLFATLLELFSVPTPDTHGHSLLPLLRGETERVREFACSGHQSGEEIVWSLRTPEWAFFLPVTPRPDEVTPSPPRLYLKPDDRWEVNDLLQQHLELAEGLEQTLREYVKGSGAGAAQGASAGGLSPALEDVSGRG